MPGFLVHHQLLELAQTHIHQVGDAIQPSYSLSSLSPPAFNLSSIRVFLNESALCIRWPKYWSFSFGISPSNELNLLLLGNILFTKYVLSHSVVSLLHDIYVLNKIFLIKIFREPSKFSAFERCIKTLFFFCIKTLI